MCERQEQLVGYLYGELDADERREMDGHMAVCAGCRDELAGLRATRTHLSLWAPPEPDLGFRVIRGAASPQAAAPAPRRLAPVFAFAAAAVIVLAAAAAIANIEVRYGSDGMTVRTGWARGSGEGAPAAPAAAPAVQASAAGSAPEAFAALNDRLDQLEAALAVQPAAAARPAADGGMSDAEMLRRVRQIVTDAEARQRVTVAQLLMQAVNDFERQRRIDLAAMQQGMGLTNAEMAQTRDIVNQLMRVATRQEKQ